MNTKAKKKTHGGARKRAGRPKTGNNTVTISFSVHKDFAEPIKALVKAKVAELKAAKTGVVVDQPEISAIPTVPKTNSEVRVPKEAPKEAKKSVRNESADNFLEGRRKSKLGIK